MTSTQTTVEHLDVLVVGAGISGIGAGRYLTTQLPSTTFAILEARGASGGTWDLFRYPGVRSDSDLHTFGYEFKPWRDEESIASAPRILAYLRETATENGRDPAAITIAVEKLTVIDRDRDAAMARAIPTVQTSSKTYERDVDQMQFALDRHIFGSVDDVKRRVAEFVDNGVTHFELKLIYPSMDELTRQMELWADEILPLYR